MRRQFARVGSAVSRQQTEVCSARIPDPGRRSLFVELLDRADEMIRQAAEMRRSAWRIYHRDTGRVPVAEVQRRRREQRERAAGLDLI